MRLTYKHLNEVFHEPGADTLFSGAFWFVIFRAKRDKGIELREALECVRKNPLEVSIFVEKILQPSNLEDVVNVIDMIVAEKKRDDIYLEESLRMLHAWRAKTLMMNVISMRNKISRDMSARKTENSCD